MTVDHFSSSHTYFFSLTWLPVRNRKLPGQLVIGSQTYSCALVAPETRICWGRRWVGLQELTAFLGGTEWT